MTGAASGIGAAVAARLAERGDVVVCADVDFDRASAVVDRLVAAGAEAVAVPIDVSDHGSVTGVIDGVMATYGRLDHAVNSAGISGQAGADLLTTTPEQWRRVIEVNLTGVFLCMRAEIAAMTQVSGGAVVNLASALGLVGRAELAPYVAAKHGVIGATKAAALEFGTRGIRVNAVCPGYIETPMIAQMPDDARDQITDLHPIGRLGTADEFADVVAFLPSDEASFVTGSHFAVDGGYVAQ